MHERPVEVVVAAPVATDVEDEPSRNLDELVSAAAVFERDQPDATVVDWLEHAALISDVDSVQDGASCVTLMTLHAAKGLEFPSVYLIGLEDGLLPFRRREDTNQDEEEERRLCFVGMTRAQRRLTLSRARYRMLRGVTNRTTRSPFLDELPRDQIEWVELSRKSSRADGTTPSGRLPQDFADWTIGTLVRHPDRGLGRVMSLTRSSKRTHVDVLFESGARQSWVLEFADFERVDFDDVD